MNAKVLVVLALVLTALCLSDGKPVSLSYRCPCRFFESHYCTCLNRVSFHGAAPLTQGYWVLLSCAGQEPGLREPCPMVSPRVESHQEGCLGVPGPVSLGKA
uniref:C-X-C motif chemokine ligand 12 n=1 Tax=Callithrix jacchus TaxID=9483 RepID=A0A5F4WE56_CALJA